jgi:hypothetical protein
LLFRAGCPWTGFAQIHCPAGDLPAQRCICTGRIRAAPRALSPSPAASSSPDLAIAAASFNAAGRCPCPLSGDCRRDQKPGWGVTYTARVRITVTAGGRPPLIREGSGAGHGIDGDLGQAHESALKEAETDAMKRALMTFGNPFGLALYAKQ